MNKIKKIVAILTAACLLAAGFVGCGSNPPAEPAEPKSETAQVSTPTPEPTPEATPEPTPEPKAEGNKDDRSLEEILNDVLNKREAEKAEAAASVTEEPAPEDPFKAPAQECISQALELCRSASETADLLSQSSYAFAEHYATGEEGDVTLADYLNLGDEQLVSVKNDRDALGALLSGLKFDDSAETDLGVEIRQQLIGVLGEMDKSYAQMQELIEFYRDQNELFAEHMDFDMSYENDDEQIQFIWQYYDALLALQKDYRKMKKPDLVAEIWDRNTESLTITAQSMYSSYVGLAADSQLDNYVFLELSEYDDILSAKYNSQVLNTMADCYGQTALVFSDTYADVLKKIKKNTRTWETSSYSRISEPEFEYSIVKEIYPNGYPSLDSVINLTASTTAAKQDVVISAQVVGFTQEYRQKVTLTTRPQYFMIKPALLTELPDLYNTKKTQINFTITDNDTGKLLVQETQNVTLYSVYDFFWETDEFGANSMFDLLGWLRPESDAVDAINRQAISYLESTGMGSALVGYQYEYSYNEDVNTLIQVAAIQKAISDLGIRYTLDAYSFGAHQHILTPDQVLAKKTGLCIESSLLMASCLMSAGFHVMLVIIPGHAQVAVESWNAGNWRSGEYYLIETTALPYDGFYIQDGLAYFGDLIPNLMDPTGEWWDDYLSRQDGGTILDGDVFIIDCDLRTIMNIQGLENFHEDLHVDPVSYPEGGSSSGGSGDQKKEEPENDNNGNDGGGNSSEGNDAEGNDGEGNGDEGNDGGEEDPSGPEFVVPDPSDENYSDYVQTVTSGSGQFSFDIPKELTADTSDDSVVIVPFDAKSDIPFMAVYYGEGLTAEEYIKAWIDMIKEDESVIDPPSDYTQMEVNGRMLYGVEYEVTGGTIESMFLYDLGNETFAAFYVISENDTSDEMIEYMARCFQTALISFKVNEV